MPQRHAPARTPRRVVAVRATIAVLMLIAVLYLLSRELHSLEPSGGSTPAGSATRYFTLSRILAVSATLLLCFVVGSYLMIRVGRAVAPRREPAEPTTYTDAWSRARVSDDQIREATQEPPECAGGNHGDE